LVALKVFHRDLDGSNARERFGREVRSAAALNHPNIVTVHDYGEHGAQPYIVMEYVAGESLAEIIRRRAPVSLADRLRWIEELAAGIGYAHRHSVLHRDIKPANLIIDRSGRLKILDFGIGRMPGIATDGTDTFGTLGYMAPEQILGTSVDERADVFAIGAVSYELLSYAEAFPGDSLPAVTHRTLSEEPVPLTQLITDLHPDIAAIVERALKKNAEERFGDAESFGAAVSRVRHHFEADLHEAGAPISSRPAPSPRSPRPTGPRQEPLPRDATSRATPSPERRTDREMLARRRAAQCEAVLQEARAFLAAGELTAALDACQQALTFDETHAGALALEHEILATVIERDVSDTVVVPSRDHPVASAPTVTTSRGTEARPTTVVVGQTGVPPQRKRTRPSLRARLARVLASARSVGEASSSTRALPADDVQLTVFRPKVIRPNVWRPLMAAMHLAERRPDAPADAPSPLEQVQTIARQVLGAERTQFSDITVDARQAVPHEGEITLVPSVDGIEFNPSRATFRWVEDQHVVWFRLRADDALDGHTARGRIAAYLGVVLIAEVDIALKVESTASADSDVDLSEPVAAKAYRRIFASYSHLDAEIVRQVALVASSLGDSFVRDVTHLRAGERWGRALKRLINQADVFQLFWSWNAMRSPHVRREWEYALSLRRDAFIRPTYWEDPLPELPQEGLPPEELKSLHFHQLAGIRLERVADNVVDRLPASRDVDDVPAPRTAPKRMLRTSAIAAAAVLAVSLGVLIPMYLNTLTPARPTPSDVVTTPPEPPPKVAAAPATVELSVTPMTIAPDQPVTIRWKTSGATRVEITPLGSVDPQGSVAVVPADSQTYTLTAYNADNVPTTRSVQVRVQQAAASPPSLVLQASSPGVSSSPDGLSVEVGQPVILSWKAGNATNARIDAVSSIDLEGTSGQQTAVLRGEGEYQFSLVAADAQGREVRSTPVVVRATCGPFLGRILRLRVNCPRTPEVEWRRD
jgi:hypothetical protein